MSWPEKPNLKHTARLFCKPASKAYQDGWDAVFGKRGASQDANACSECKARLLYEGEVLCDECLELARRAEDE